jgi:thiol-disulfide isomerase/thioredoxin
VPNHDFCVTRGNVNLQVEEAEANLPEQENGIYMPQSSEQVDALVKVNADKTVILLAGLSWCRPCMSLTRPLQKLAKHYEGAVFAKILGDHSDNTKTFFKDALKACTLTFQISCSGCGFHRGHSWCGMSKCAQCIDGKQVTWITFPMEIVSHETVQLLGPHACMIILLH